MISIKRENNLIYYGLLLLVLLVAYAPVASLYFGMKNDAFSDNFPNKFFFTESIRAGYLPLWNPYLNFGFPVYADFGFAFWSPVTWFFGAVIGYNAYTLTIEVLFYIYLAGLCMYKLSNYLKFNKKLSFAIASMYMCSGFFVGNLQHINFLTSAAFLPLVIKCLLKIFDSPSIKNSFWLAVSLYFIYCSGHPAIPIVTGYFLFILFLLLCLFNYSSSKRLSVIAYAFTGFIISLIFFSPAIYSYYNILEEYSRNKPVLQAVNSDTGFGLISYLSFIFPFAGGVKSSSFFSDDVSMRNAYFSLVGLAALFVAVKSNQRVPKIFFIAGLIILLFSVGGILKEHIYSQLPLLKYIKTNGEFRVFTILCFCIVAGYGMNEVFKKNLSAILSIKRILIAMLCIATALCITIPIFILQNAGTLPASKQNVKALLDNAPVSIYLLVSSLITLFFLSVSLFCIKKGKLNLLVWIIIADISLNAILYLPITGIGLTKVSEIQAYYNQSPKGIPIPALQPIKSTKRLDKKTTGLIGDWTLYSKQPGTTDIVDYPSYFASTKNFFTDTESNRILDQPFLFLQNDYYNNQKSATINIVAFTPTSIKVQVNSKGNDRLIFLQNNYKFWRARNNGESIKITPAYTSFMSVPVVKGQNEITFLYEDRWLLIIFVGAMICFTLLVIIIFKKDKALTS